DLGVRTHFLKVVDGNRMRVRRVQVIPDYDRINPSTRNFLIQLEVIARYYVAGSFHDRIQAGKVRPESVGFPRGHVPKYGEPLPRPFVEVTTKLEKVDRELTEDEALKISKLSRVEFDDLVRTVLKIDERLNMEVRKRGLIHVDGKKEFAMDDERRLMLVDTFGTADEDRFWDLEAYETGQQVELSKEFVRQYYRKIGYHQALMDARTAGKPEPDIPPRPALSLGQSHRPENPAHEGGDGEHHPRDVPAERHPRRIHPARDHEGQGGSRPRPAEVQERTERGRDCTAGHLLVRQGVRAGPESGDFLVPARAAPALEPVDQVAERTEQQHGPGGS